MGSPQPESLEQFQKTMKVVLWMRKHGMSASQIERSLPQIEGVFRYKAGSIGGSRSGKYKYKKSEYQISVPEDNDKDIAPILDTLQSFVADPPQKVGNKLPISTNEIPITGNTYQEDTKQLPANNQQILAEIIKSYQSGELRQIIESFKASGPLDSSAARPKFKGKKKNTGISISDEILDRAIQKSKTEKSRTGGSLSLLVELLLWHYIGSPSDMLE